MFRPTYNPDLFFYWFEMPVRFRDLDPLNHVNNALFNTYFEEARIHFLEEVAKMSGAFEKGMTFVLVKSVIEYIGQITYPGNILIGTGIKKIGNTSITALQAIYGSETKQLLSIAETTGVWFDLARQRPTKLPDIMNLEKLMVIAEE